MTASMTTPKTATIERMEDGRYKITVTRGEYFCSSAVAPSIQTAMDYAATKAKEVVHLIDCDDGTIDREETQLYGHSVS